MAQSGLPLTPVRSVTAAAEDIINRKETPLSARTAETNLPSMILKSKQEAVTHGLYLKKTKRQLMKQ